MIPKLLFCDDDEVLREGLISAVSEFFKAEEIALPECHEFSSGEELLNSEIAGDIAFLDIEMSGMSGIELASRLKRINPRIIIFMVTSYNEYLDDAMKLQVFRYISKPIDKPRLFRNLKEALYAFNNSIKSILVETESGLARIFAEDIVCIESCGRRSVIYTKDGEIPSLKGIDHHTKELNLPCFFSALRGCLVNMDYVSFFNEKSIRLTCESYSREVYISRRRYKPFKESYLSYMRSSQ